MRLLVILGALGLLTVACDDDCGVHAVQEGELCLPAAAQAGVPIVLEAADICAGCMDESLACSTKVRGGVIDVSLEMTRCHVPDTECPAMCVFKAAACEVKALSEGDYEVRMNGELRGTLAVRQEGQTDCRVEHQTRP